MALRKVRANLTGGWLNLPFRERDCQSGRCSYETLALYHKQTALSCLKKKLSFCTVLFSIQFSIKSPKFSIFIVTFYSVTRKFSLHVASLLLLSDLFFRRRSCHPKILVEERKAGRKTRRMGGKKEGRSDSVFFSWAPFPVTHLPCPNQTVLFLKDLTTKPSCLSFVSG